MKIQRPISKQPIPDTAKKVFKGKLFDVYQWDQELFDGSITIFEKVKTQDIAIIIPVTKEGKIMTCIQEQPGSTPFTGVFGGRIEEGEDPLGAAKRELLEETGYSSNEFIPWDAVQLFTNFEFVTYIFIAKNCEKTTFPNLDKGERIRVKLVTFPEFIKLIHHESFRGMAILLKILKMQSNKKEMSKLKKLLS